MSPHEATLCFMRTVGIRELKNRLSTYLREARAGRTVAITDRGRVVAELTPPRKNGRQNTFAELVRRGAPPPPNRHGPPASPPTTDPPASPRRSNHTHPRTANQ